MFGLPFREIWVLDFEYSSESGALPVPVCMVARELCSDRLIRLWQDELESLLPFDIGDDVLFVSELRAGGTEAVSLNWDGRCRSGFWICTPSSATKPTASRCPRVAGCFRRCPTTE